VQELVVDCIEMGQKKTYIMRRIKAHERRERGQILSQARMLKEKSYCISKIKS